MPNAARLKWDRDPTRRATEIPGEVDVGRGCSRRQRCLAADLASDLRRSEAGFRDSRTRLGLGGPLGQRNPDSVVESRYQEGHLRQRRIHCFGTILSMGDALLGRLDYLGDGQVRWPSIRFQPLAGCYKAHGVAGGLLPFAGFDWAASAEPICLQQATILDRGAINRLAMAQAGPPAWRPLEQTGLSYLLDLRWSSWPSRSSWGCILSLRAFSQVGSGLEVVA